MTTEWSAGQVGQPSRGKDKESLPSLLLSTTGDSLSPCIHEFPIEGSWPVGIMAWRIDGLIILYNHILSRGIVVQDSSKLRDQRFFPLFTAAAELFFDHQSFCINRTICSYLRGNWPHILQAHCISLIPTYNLVCWGDKFLYNPLSRLRLGPQGSRNNAGCTSGLGLVKENW